MKTWFAPSSAGQIDYIYRRVKNLINALLDLEASADLVIINAEKVKKIAREERLKLVGVSTPSVPRGLDQKQIAELLAGSLKRRFKKKKL